MSDENTLTSGFADSVDYSTHTLNLHVIPGVSSRKEYLQSAVDTQVERTRKETEAFIDRFHTLCEEKHVSDDRLHEITCAALEYKVRSAGIAAHGAYKPTGSRDVRHMSTGRAAKGDKSNRARNATNAHAAHIDRYRSQMSYIAALERQFCTSKDRKYKRTLRQIARLLCRDTHLALPVVFGGTKWYTEGLCK